MSDLSHHDLSLVYQTCPLIVATQNMVHRPAGSITWGLLDMQGHGPLQTTEVEPAF